MKSILIREARQFAQQVTVDMIQSVRNALERDKRLTSEFAMRTSAILNKAPSEWPKIYSFSFIEPGLVSYEEQGQGKCYLSKETLDKLCPTFIGRPIVSAVNHVDGMQPEDFEKVAGGVITRVYWNPDDNWYCADAVIWDQELRNQCEGGKYSVSCAYVVTKHDQKGGIRNNITYQQEVLDGTGTHIAIVPNPRYNGAKILLNAIGGTGMKFKAMLKRLGAEFKNAIFPDGSMINIDGAQVPVKEIVSAVEEEQAEEEARKKKELEAAAPVEEEIGEDSTLDIGGKQVTIKDAVNCYKNKLAKKNAAADEEKKKKEDAEKAAKEAEEKKNVDDEAEKKKKEEELKAADAKKKEEEAAALEKKNSLEAENRKKFLELKNRSDNRHKFIPEVSCVEDKRAQGQSLYGSNKTGGK